MPDWFDIPESQDNPGAPVSSDWAKAVGDNPVAMADGEPGAPSVLPNVAVNMVAGEVGSLAFARCLIDVAYGSTVGGSNLRPTSAPYEYDGPTSITQFQFNFGAPLTGTWRCLGMADAATANNGSANQLRGATLFMRIL